MLIPSLTFPFHCPKYSLKYNRFIKKLVFCTGQIYYELLNEREQRGRKDVALVRLEQIAPFPFDRIGIEAETYPNADIIWAQQEPK